MIGSFKEILEDFLLFIWDRDLTTCVWSAMILLIAKISNLGDFFLKSLRFSPNPKPKDDCKFKFQGCPQVDNGFTFIIVLIFYICLWEMIEDRRRKPIYV